MAFRSVFVAVVLGVALVVAAFLLNAKRPSVERDQPRADLAALAAIGLWARAVTGDPLRITER